LVSEAVASVASSAGASVASVAVVVVVELPQAHNAKIIATTHSREISFFIFHILLKKI
jgi:hypothetical protein